MLYFIPIELSTAPASYFNNPFTVSFSSFIPNASISFDLASESSTILSPFAKINSAFNLPGRMESDCTAATIGFSLLSYTLHKETIPKNRINKAAYFIHPRIILRLPLALVRLFTRCHASCTSYSCFSRNFKACLDMNIVFRNCRICYSR